MEGAGQNFDWSWYLNLTFVFAGSVLVAWGVSYWLRRLYRKAVRKRMGGGKRRARPAAQAAADTPKTKGRTTPPRLHAEPLDAGATRSLSEAAQRLDRRAGDARLSAAGNYVVGGALYAIVAGVGFSVWVEGAKELVGPWHSISMLVVFLWPLLWTILAVVGADWRRRVAAYSAFALLLLLLLFSLPGERVVFEAARWAGYMLPPNLVAWVLMNRRVKGFGIVVLIFTAVLSLSFLTARLPERFGEGWDRLSFFIAPGVMILFLGVACWVLLWMGKRHKDKTASDQSVVLDTYWLLVAEWAAVFSMIIYESRAWVAVPLFGGALALNWGIIYVLFRWWNPLKPDRNVRLLLLRVFGPAGGRAERLIEELGVRWRYAGSIQLIAADDVAAATIEVNELIDFVTGRLDDHFIKNKKELTRLARRLDLKPDLDGRFRVNEFFCYDNVWRDAVNRLFKRSDVVLADLRGFAPRPGPGGGRKKEGEGYAFTREEKERGIVYEIRQVVNFVPVGKLVFLVDDTTDEKYLQAVFDAAWRKMEHTSENNAPGTPAPRTLKAKSQSSAEVRRLVSVLFEAAQPFPPPVPAATARDAATV